MTAHSTMPAPTPLDAWRRQLDAVVTDVAREHQGRIHPDLLRMPMLTLALSQAAMRCVGAEQLRAYLSWCVRAGLQPGKTVDADIVAHPETGALELRPRVVFASPTEAASVRLPGGRDDFDSFGGQPINACTSPVLRRVLEWIASPLRPNRPVVYARLHAAITLVLAARASTAAASQEPR